MVVSIIKESLRKVGLTKAKEMRDLCESLGIAVTIEDCWGGELMTTTIAHLVASTKPEFYLSSTDFNSYVNLRLVQDAPTGENGRLRVPLKPGVGIHIDERLLGKPNLSIR